jgi:D-3-phosphoglycerate dehydrogenase
MPDYRILITDYAWDTLAIEQRIFEPLGAELLVAEAGAEDELLRLAPYADAIMTNWKRVSAATLDAAPNCITVARYGVGVDNIAVDHATELGILVSNVPDYCVEEVSDHTLALLLACARSVATFDRDMRHGDWNLTAGRPLFRLRGKTLGLIGYGNIARAVVPKAMGFGLNILAYQRSRNLVGNGITLTTDLDRVLRESDYVSLHVPLNNETRGIVDAAFLRRMKPTAFLINTSRGAIIDEGALAQALHDNVIRGAALDVLTQEPPPADHPLLGLPNALITPHAAFNSVEAVEELQARTAQHVVDVLTGTLPPFVINPAVLEQPNLRMKR